MEQERLQLPMLSEKIVAWENRLEQVGYIEDETEILQHIKEMDEQTDQLVLSKLLTISAISRLGKTEKFDSLVQTWLEKAKDLDPQNIKAATLLAQFQWKIKKDHLDQLSFPPIRETDSRLIKQSTAAQIIDICRQFLIAGENDLEELEKAFKIVKSYGDGRKHEILIQLLKEAIASTSEVLKVASEFEKSTSGVFHNTTYSHDMRTHIDNLEKIKEEWSKQFHIKAEDEKEQENPLDELNQMIGLESVKQRVNAYYQFLHFQKKRQELGLQTKDKMSLNMVLTGNPGTGKTTIARLLAKIYHELGVLPRQEVIEADRSQLVGAYVGQTEKNVRAIVEKALGGVLFIDEAYSLKREGQTGNDYGQAAVDTLVSLMTAAEYAGKFALVLAGYPDEMRQFLDANPGLRSRFPSSNQIHLDDYTNDELIQIAEKLAESNDYILTAEAKIELAKRLEKERVDDTFGNARTAENIVLDAIFKKGSRLHEATNIIDYTLLEKEDFYVEEKQGLIDPKVELAQLIGLTTIKQEVNSFISYVKMQQLRRENNLSTVPIQLHSVFVGNPGTGKTTVAKIYARLLKECGMLKRGHLIVTSRADFVAGFVGQTALKTKKKIREALGGVLFIDEAYSLLSQTGGDFGKEVVDTIVDEMTKHNENLVVILAGYPDEMNMLLDSNPGLQSRFKKFYHFPDYSVPQLIEMMKSYSQKYQYDLTKEAEKYFLETIDIQTINGNGRFATNVIDEAIQAQAQRVMENRSVLTTLDEVSKITKVDVERALTKVRKGLKDESVGG